MLGQLDVDTRETAQDVFERLLATNRDSKEFDTVYAEFDRMLEEMMEAKQADQALAHIAL